jgi:ribokinase
MLDVDLLVPNQREAEALLGSVTMGRMRRGRRVDAKQITADLLALGPVAVIMKLGQRGAVYQDRAGRIEEFAGHRVDVADTTAAGDAFAGALAVALAEGRKMPEAIRFANAAGALCCESFGAQPALPAREAVEKLMDARR